MTRSKLRRTSCRGRDNGDCDLLDDIFSFSHRLFEAGLELTEGEPGVLTLVAGEKAAVHTPAWEPSDEALPLLKGHTRIKRLQIRHVRNRVLAPLLKDASRWSDLRGLVILDTGTLEHWMCEHILDIIEAATSLDQFECLSAFEQLSDAQKVGSVLARTTTLKRLSLQCHDAAKAFLEAAFGSTFNAASSITSLVIRIRSVEEYRLLSKMLETNSSITSLDVTCNSVFKRRENMGLLDLARALRVNTSVNELTMQKCDLGLKTAAALFDMLTENSVLRRLNISNNKITEEMCGVLALSLRRSRSLRHLDVQGCQISLAGATSIVEALKGSDVTLNFGDCKDQKASAAAMAKLALDNDPQRIEFVWTQDSLIRNMDDPERCPKKVQRMSFYFADDFPTDSVSSFLKRDGATVHSLCVALSRPNPSLCEEIAALMYNDALEELSVSTGFIKDSGVYILAKALQHNDSLARVHFSLKDTEPTLKELYTLFAQAIAANTCLESVSISFLPTDTVLEEFGTGLASNYSITKFSLVRGNLLSRGGGHRESIQRLVMRNRAYQQAGLHFVVEKFPLKKHWARGFELTCDTGILERSAMAKLNQSREEVVTRIKSRKRHLREKFFVITGVVKEVICCRKSYPGATQLDHLGTDCLAHVANFLKVDDVKDDRLL